MKKKIKKPRTIFEKFIDEVTKREGGKKSISRAQVSEVVGIISDMTYKNIAATGFILACLGQQRSTKRRKK